MKACSHCGKVVPDHSAHCLFCGEPQPAIPAGRSDPGAFAETLLSAPPPRGPGAPSPTATLPDEARPTEVMTAAPDFGPPGTPRAPAADATGPSPSAAPAPAQAPPRAINVIPPTRQHVVARLSDPEVSGRRPPVLASESLEEDLYPTRPGHRAIRLWYAIAGLLLAAAFAAPLGLGPKPTFVWDMLGSLDGVAFVGALVPAGAAVLLWASAALPLPYLLRGAVGLLLGLLALGLFAAGQVHVLPLSSIAGEPWRLPTMVAGMALLPVALLHRARYRASTLARALAILSSAAVAVPLVVPIGRLGVPALAYAQLEVKGEHWAATVLVGGLLLGALLAWIVWLPRTWRAAGTWLAALAIAPLPLYHALVAIFADCPAGAAPSCHEEAALQQGRMGALVLGLHVALTYGLAHALAPLSRRRRRPRM